MYLGALARVMKHLCGSGGIGDLFQFQKQECEKQSKLSLTDDIFLFQWNILSHVVGIVKLVIARINRFCLIVVSSIDRFVVIVLSIISKIWWLLLLVAAIISRLLLIVMLVISRINW